MIWDNWTFKSTTCNIFLTKNLCLVQSDTSMVCKNWGFHSVWHTDSACTNIMSHCVHWQGLCVYDFLSVTKPKQKRFFWTTEAAQNFCFILFTLLEPVLHKHDLRERWLQQPLRCECRIDAWWGSATAAMTVALWVWKWNRSIRQRTSLRQSGNEMKAKETISQG